MSTMDFEGNTFVGFIDISGFTRTMETEEELALDTLDRFYNSGFRILGNQSDSYPTIRGMFISDCAVLFARSKPDGSNRIKVLKKMLKIIKAINKDLIKDKIMLTSSIAYGKFRYQKRNIVLGKVNKEFIYGRPYLKAYVDNSDSGRPKIRPGECRILIDNDFPPDVDFHINTSINNQSDNFDKAMQDRNHYYYYWMCNNVNLINIYKSNYDAIYSNIRQFNNDDFNDQKYKEIALLIQSYSSNSLD
jgi:hypothetical protein